MTDRIVMSVRDPGNLMRQLLSVGMRRGRRGLDERRRDQGGDLSRGNSRSGGLTLSGDTRESHHRRYLTSKGGREPGRSWLYRNKTKRQTTDAD